MDSKAIREVFEELFSHLERLETQSAATLQFLKEKKRVTDKQLAPYLEQAGNAANVKWRAARVRIERLLSDEDEGDKKIEKKPEIAQAETAQSEKKKADEKDQSSDRQAVAASDKREEPADKQKPADDQQIQAASLPQEPKHEEANHPTEMTQEAVQRDSGKPTDEMKPEDKDQEAA